MPIGLAEVPAPAQRGNPLVLGFRREVDRFRNGNGQIRRHLIRRRLEHLESILSYPVRWLLAVLLRILLEALKPVVQIRFARLGSCSLGLFALPTEAYLCEREAGLHPRNAFDVFYRYDRDAGGIRPPSKREAMVCNEQLDRMFRPHLRIWPLAGFLDRLNRMLPRGSESFIVPMPQPNDRFGVLEPFAPHLSFSPDEEVKGRREMERMGVPAGSPFVCFHARDGAWAFRVRPRIKELYGDWYPGQERNASITHCLLAAERLTQLGYAAIRMGKHVEGPIETTNPRIIDYAWNHQSDFMDIYLSARCVFFLGQNSGMTSVPMAFRKCLAFINIYPMSEFTYTDHTDSVFIPKLLHSKKLGRFLTFREVAEWGLDTFFWKYPNLRETGQELGLSVVENSPEEIWEVASEVHQRLQGIFAPTGEDEELHRRFIALVKAYPKAMVHEKGLCKLDEPHIRMGAAFLRNHRELLD